MANMISVILKHARGYQVMSRVMVKLPELIKGMNQAPQKGDFIREGSSAENTQVYS